MSILRRSFLKASVCGLVAYAAFRKCAEGETLDTILTQERKPIVQMRSEVIEALDRWNSLRVEGHTDVEASLAMNWNPLEREVKFRTYSKAGVAFTGPGSKAVHRDFIKEFYNWSTGRA